MPSNCSNCSAAFNVEPEESAWLEAHGGNSPTLCPRCRSMKEGLQDESITCVGCGKVFIFPRELRWYARMFHWQRPKRCIGGCKTGQMVQTDQEKLMADFLRRLRAVNKATSMSLTMNSGPGSISRRFQAANSIERPQSSSKGPSDAPGGAGSVAGMGGSLAAALKEFQDRKRKKA